MKLRVVLALCGLSALLLLPAVYAQEEEQPKGPQMDEISKRLLENWDKSTYHLGRLGVKKASCKVKFKMSRMGQETTFNLTYKWDGEKGEIEWDNPQMGAMFSEGGRFQERFDSDFKRETLPAQFGTAKCTAKATEEGHVVTVDGKTKAGFKSLTFDKDGVLTQLVMETPGQMGGMQKIAMKLTYTKVDGKYLLESQNGEMEGGMGKMGLVIKFTYAKVGDYQVKQRQVTNVSMGGTPMGSHTMEYTDWKLSDDVDAAPKPAEPERSEEK
ncbi:MAG: hypothetical protein ACYS0K_11515 [Planctomycetota bacterium]|jgi:hypothetical protein